MSLCALLSKSRRETPSYGGCTRDTSFCPESPLTVVLWDLVSPGTLLFLLTLSMHVSSLCLWGLHPPSSGLCLVSLWSIMSFASRGMVTRQVSEVGVHQFL